MNVNCNVFSQHCVLLLKDFVLCSEWSSSCRRWGKGEKIALNIDTKMLKIGFIGGGKMAQALAKGFIRAGKETIYLSSCI